MITLTTPIGKTLGNKRNEVLAIQKRLNFHLNCMTGYKPIAENGVVGPDTIDAIRIFQKMINVPRPDAIIRPNGPTLKKLNQASIPILNPTAACQVITELKIRKLIISRLNIVERATWHAQEPASMPSHDWNYHSIAIHHAGNSFSCAAKGVDEMRRAEAIDMNSFGQLSYHYAVDCQGTIYEALDIRSKGAHIEKGNTGVIGIVFLADFSLRGEAGKHGPGVSKMAKEKGVMQAAKEFLGVQKDNVAFRYDEPTEKQMTVADNLVRTLTEFFPIKKIGGHREFANSHRTSRACPGTYGMIIAEEMRRKFKLLPP